MSMKNLLELMVHHPIRTLIVIFALVAGIYGLVHTPESEHPRSGYIKTGRQVTEQQCTDEGGTVVDDVCYTP